MSIENVAVGPKYPDCLYKPQGCPWVVDYTITDGAERIPCREQFPDETAARLYAYAIAR